MRLVKPLLVAAFLAAAAPAGAQPSDPASDTPAAEPSASLPESPAQASQPVKSLDRCLEEVVTGRRIARARCTRVEMEAARQAEALRRAKAEGRPTPKPSAKATTCRKEVVTGRRIAKATCRRGEDAEAVQEATRDWMKRGSQINHVNTARGGVDIDN